MSTLPLLHALAALSPPRKATSTPSRKRTASLSSIIQTARQHLTFTSRDTDIRLPTPPESSYTGLCSTHFLPPEIWELILTDTALSLRDLLVTCRLVSRKWKDFVDALLQLDNAVSRMMYNKTCVKVSARVCLSSSCYAHGWSDGSVLASCSGH